MKHEHAIALGQKALIWIAADPTRLAALLEAGALAPDAIRARAAEPEFLGFLLDFVLASDEDVLAFAADAGIAPDEPARARAALGGGEPHWT